MWELHYIIQKYVLFWVISACHVRTIFIYRLNFYCLSFLSSLTLVRIHHGKGWKWGGGWGVGEGNLKFNNVLIFFNDLFWALKTYKIVFIKIDKNVIRKEVQREGRRIHERRIKGFPNFGPPTYFSIVCLVNALLYCMNLIS